MKAWVAVDKNGSETIFEDPPYRDKVEWCCNGSPFFVVLPRGSIKKLIGRELSWKDEPVKLKEE